MRAVAVAIAVCATGCISVGAAVGANGAVDGSPNRVLNTQYNIGTYVAIKDAVVLEPSFNVMLGPLGNKSEPIPTFGLRVITHSCRWRPGFFGALWAGDGGIDYAHAGRSVDASIYRIGAGVSWDGHSYLPDDEDPWWYDGFGVIAVGVVYIHHSQEGIAAGDFLGVELSVTGGFSIQGLLHGLTNGNPNAH